MGKVLEPAVPVTEFTVPGDNGSAMPIASAKLRDTTILDRDRAQDAERVEHLVRVDWIKTMPETEAIWETGFFANQNSACKLRSRSRSSG